MKAKNGETPLAPTETPEVMEEALKAILKIAESINIATLPDEVGQKINRILAIARYQHEIRPPIEGPTGTPTTRQSDG